MPTVIVENDESQWDDITGETYHFPKRYANLLLPGTQVVYYKGKLRKADYRKDRLSDEPHYFGIALVGNVFSDKRSRKGDLFASIENYQPFNHPVFIKQDDEYIEQIPESRQTNYWRDGVREVTDETYNVILSLSGGPAQASGINAKRPEANLNDVEQELESYLEGSKKQRFVTVYERKPKYRKQAIMIHGLDCMGCGFNFEDYYGDYGKGFIHVHHQEPLSSTEEEQRVNPETDLAVLCPNCHSMVHRYRNKTLTIDQLRAILKAQGKI